MATITDIISCWPSIEDFAADAGVSVGLARVWKTRKSIPADRWSRIAAKAETRGIGQISLHILADSHARDAA